MTIMSRPIRGLAPRTQDIHSPDSDSGSRLYQVSDYFARLSKAGTAARQLTRRYVGLALARADGGGREW